MKERYEFNDGKSKKFWEPKVKDNMLIVRYGRIGTKGKVHIKKFASDDEAFDARTKLIFEKVRKGYVLVSSDSATNQKSSAPNAAICHMYVGEHTEDVAKGLCRWLIKCLQNKMSPSNFAKLWNKFLEEGGECRGVPGKTGEEYWIDVLEFAEDDLDRIYKEAFEKGAERFVTFNNNAYIDIVAIKGTPPGREIALLVLKTKKNVGKWTDDDIRDALGDEYFLEEIETRNE